METATDKQTQLMDIHAKFSEQGKRLHECLDRLTNIGNRLSDESQSLKGSNESTKEPSPHLPGIVSDLSNDADGFKMLVSQLEKQINKLSGII